MELEKSRQHLPGNGQLLPQRRRAGLELLVKAVYTVALQYYSFIFKGSDPIQFMQLFQFQKQHLKEVERYLLQQLVMHRRLNSEKVWGIYLLLQE